MSQINMLSPARGFTSVLKQKIFCMYSPFSKEATHTDALRPSLSSACATAFFSFRFLLGLASLFVCFSSEVLYFKRSALFLYLPKFR